VLRDPEARARYDEELRAATAARWELPAATAQPLQRERAGASLASLSYTVLGLLLVGWGVLAGYGPLLRQERSLAARPARSALSEAPPPSGVTARARKSGAAARG
jgi:hypothetical protein